MMKHGGITILFCCFSLTGSMKTQAQDVLPPPQHGTVYVIAHRGAHKGMPENSMAAYQHAIDLKCDFVEIDVRTTRDNQIVSIHDGAIDKYVKNETGKVREMSLVEIKKLDIGEIIGEEWKNTRIPTLKEILQLCQGKIGIYLDLKDADPQQIIVLIQKYKMERQVVWYVPASNHKALMEIKQYCDRCLIMPDPGKEEHIERVVVAFQPEIIATDMGNLSANFVRQSHERQALVFADESEDEPKKREAEWQKMIDWSTDGIQTDDPEALINFLLKNK